MEEHDVFKEVLVDVRKSFRFLYQYQRRILDLMKFVEKKFGLTYQGGYVKFSNASPRNGSGNLSYWSWDWLNMYMYEFHFRKDSNNLIFSCILISDTGYFESVREKKKLFERTKLDKYVSEELSDSKLIFLLGENAWFPEFKINLLDPEFVLSERGYKEKENKKLLYESYSLDKFIDENTTLQTLADFSNKCIEKNIDFLLVNEIE